MSAETALAVAIGWGVWRLMAQETPVLMYHRIADISGDRNSVPPAIFADQMAQLHELGYRTVSLEDIGVSPKRPDRTVAITFDDAYEDNLTQALPVLQRFGFQATVFAISGWIGMPNNWEDYPNKPACRTMDADQLRAWLDAGMQVGSHTQTHPNLTRLTDATLTDELNTSRIRLEDMLQIPITSLAYPYGAFDRRVMEAAEQAGYKRAAAIFEGVGWLRANPLALRRIQITRHHIGPALATRVSPLHIVLSDLRQLERAVKRLRPGCRPRPEPTQ